MNAQQIAALEQIDEMIDDIEALTRSLGLMNSQNKRISGKLHQLWVAIEEAAEGRDLMRNKIAKLESWGFAKESIDKWMRIAPNGHRECWFPLQPNLIRIFNRNLNQVDEHQIDWSLHNI
jgi:hypothetical protein